MAVTGHSAGGLPFNRFGRSLRQGSNQPLTLGRRKLCFPVIPILYISGAYRRWFDKPVLSFRGSMAEGLSMDFQWTAQKFKPFALPALGA